MTMIVLRARWERKRWTRDILCIYVKRERKVDLGLVFVVDGLLMKDEEGRREDFIVMLMAS